MSRFGSSAWYSLLILVILGAIAGVKRSRQVSDQIVMTRQSLILVNELNKYREVCGRYPGDEGEVSVLQKNSPPECPKWIEQKSIPILAPSGRSYIFQIINGKAEIFTSDKSISKN